MFKLKIQEREIFEKPTKEKLDASEFFKNEGNKAFKSKELDKAAYFYQKVIEASNCTKNLGFTSIRLYIY